MKIRHSKTPSQQCRYYKVDDIFEYMYETYINGNHSQLKTLYKELRREARKEFVAFCFEMVSPNTECERNSFCLLFIKRCLVTGVHEKRSYAPVGVGLKLSYLTFLWI